MRFFKQPIYRRLILRWRCHRHNLNVKHGPVGSVQSPSERCPRRVRIISEVTATLSEQDNSSGLTDAVFEIEAVASELAPMLQRMQRLVTLFDQNSGNFPQHFPVDLQIRHDEIFSVQQSAERTFLRHNSLYPAFKDEWVLASREKWEQMTAYGYRDVLSEEYALLRKAAAFLRGKAQMPQTGLPVVAAVINYYGGVHNTMGDITMNNTAEIWLVRAPLSSIRTSQ